MQLRHRQPLRTSFANAQTQWNLKHLVAVIIREDVPKDCLADTGCRKVSHHNVWELTMARTPEETFFSPNPAPKFD